VNVLAAISTGSAFAIGVAVGLLVVVLFVAFRTGARRRRTRGPDIPPGMRSGPSDADLEKPLLEKLQMYGVGFVVFMALWVPVVFLTEPDTNKNDTVEMIEQSVDRGMRISEPGTEENPMGFNCVRCHGDGLAGGQNLFNGTIVPVPDLTTVCGGAAFGHPAIESLDDVVQTIARGRQGTDMPSWSVRFAGAMHDQMINDVVNYILSIQDVPDDQNVCLGSPAAAAAPTPVATPSAPIEATPTPTP
jgi:mono/diheme cytochrome c family protein